MPANSKQKDAQLCQIYTNVNKTASNC